MERKNLLIIGGGGREHAIIWKLAKSPHVGKIYCAPGNAGIAELAECVNITATDISAILEFLKNHPDIYMTVVGPDDPLSLGLVDKLEAEGFRVFGPTKAASQLEASKVFSKNLMQKYDIPTANYETFSDYSMAIEFVKGQKTYPLVIKADGLALGKGVLICENFEEAEQGLKQIMLDKAFGEAGQNVVIEEFLKGFEVSVLAFCDGKTILPMASARDYKRAHDNDIGLNTGGMGTYSPNDKYLPKHEEFAYDHILKKTVDALNSEGIKFKGVIFFGFMINGDNVKVLEYNARFGDPETQSVLPRLENDLMEVFEAVIDERLNEIDLRFKEEKCVTVVLASGGYPEKYEKHIPITLPDKLPEGVTIFHAGTAMINNQLVTNGGRVINISALGKTIEDARKKAYKIAKKVKFKNKHLRTDIAKL
ncbi:MAG: phosphoribosylamine--glycine ligase [Firmicutes bacterium]|nr:phosphoribosylamine--glycine ligase [Bacillota bacterium]